MTQPPAPPPTGPDSRGGSAYANYDSWKGWAVDFSYSDRERVYYGKEFGDVAGKKVLEIGFGNGGFLQWATDNGAAAMGTELDRASVAAAQEKDFQAWTADDTIPEADFDLIVAIDVLEHLEIPDLFAMLHLFSDKLAPDGVAVCRFPNGGSPFGRATQHGDLTHRATLNESSIRQALAICEAPLDIHSVRNQAYVFGFYGGRTIKPLISTLRYPVRRLLDFLIVNIWDLQGPIGHNLVVRFERRERPSLGS